METEKQINNILFNFTYKGYTGILGDVFNAIHIKIINNDFIIFDDLGNERKFFIASFEEKEYVFKFRGKKVFLGKKGIKHFKETQNLNDCLFTRTRGVLENLLYKEN